MEFEEIKNIWENMEEKYKIIPYQISEVSQLEYKNKINNFRKGEIIGLIVAYAFACFILYTFNALDEWYLRLSGFVVVIYLLVMPLYTLNEIWNMKHIDLANQNYKTVLEQFYARKSNLYKAEKISIIASPILFFASIMILTKAFTGKDLFDLNFQLPVILLIGIALVGAIYFNVWAFRKRNKQFKSVKQLLEE